MTELAEAGVFNRSGFTPMESAATANLYEALHYISYKSELNNELQARHEKALKKR